MKKVIVTALTAGLLVSCGGWNRSAKEAAQMDKISRVLELIKSDYIDSVGFDSIAEVVIPQIMSTLDPHSIYIPAREFDQMNESLQGGFGGIGIRFMMLTDTATVTNVIANGPSDKAGLQNGDRIMKIDTTKVAGIKFDNDKVVKMLRGDIGTKVELEIQRAGRRLTKSVTRGQVPIPSLTAWFMVEPGTGYIKLDQFSRTTHDEVRDAVRLLKREGATRLVLDLRGNPGGYLDQAEKLADEFLTRGKMIVYTEDKNHRRTEAYSSGGEMADLPLAIIIDQNSASSSEIVAGAIQDNDRGTIVGRRSFGKGLVQEQVAFADGSAVRLTVARYYTPTGRSIQKPYNNARDYALETYSRSGEYFSADSVKLADSLKFTTPGGRTVYGGGGIMPDVFVPLDTLYMTDYYIEGYARALTTLFSLRWTDAHRAEVNAVHDVASLNALLDAAPLWDEYVRFALTEGVRGKREDLEKSRATMLAMLRGEIGRYTPLGEAGFFSQYYAVDQPLREAVKKVGEKI